MIDNDTIDRLIQRLIVRIEDANTYFLMKMGSSISKIKELTPTQAQQLVQILKYGGNYEQILNELSKYTGLNIKDVDDIFYNYAKIDQSFYEQFYQYRAVPFIPIENNLPLKQQTMALAKMIKNEMYNYTRTNMLGYTIKDANGKTQFLGLRETYNRVLDEALINVSQGKETFDSAMIKIMKNIGGSGLKTVEYESGRAIRLDSVIRMHMNDGLKNLHNVNQEMFGEEFDYNGIEVTHHQNAAPDHIDTVDGKQFALIDNIKRQISQGIENNIKLEDIRGNQVRVNGKIYDDFNAINNSLSRKVSTLNCRHTIFPIIVGVSKPEYTQEQLDIDKENNINGCEIDGKYYSLYEVTQLQRRLERKIREQKDIQILAKASDNKQLINEAQQKITQLTRKYKEVSDVSGLPTQMQRMKVSGYRRTKIK